MINSKLEKVFFVFVLYLFLIVFRFVLPISDKPSNLDRFVVIVLSVIATGIIYYVYTYHRNKHILKNINDLLKANKTEEVINYTNTCIKKNKSRPIYMYKLYAMAMCGQIIEFEKMISECEKSSKYKKLISLDFVKCLKAIANYFKTSCYTFTKLKQPYWNQIMSVLSEDNHNTNIPVLLSLYDTNFGLIKTALAFKLYLTYLQINDVEKSDYYYSEVLKHAPSAEIIRYIEASKTQEERE